MQPRRVHRAVIPNLRADTDIKCVDGLKYMFPKAMKKMQSSGDYNGIFALHEAVKDRPKIKEYLASDRRQKYSMGIYRYYEELDVTA